MKGIRGWRSTVPVVVLCITQSTLRRPEMNHYIKTVSLNLSSWMKNLKVGTYLNRNVLHFD